MPAGADGPGTDEILRLREAERHEQEPGLVDVGVVPVDDGDVRLVPPKARRSRLAVSVPPVPPPRITIACTPRLPPS